jgi:glycosyltransferase involved in cell wall biosynthesis
MQLLISLFNLNISGSSTYTYTLVQELARLGHVVHIFSPFHQEMTRELQKLGTKIFKHIPEIRDQNYDCIIAQHNFLAVITRGVFPNVPMLYISHGVIPELEQPPSADLNIYKFITVSEEVRQSLTQKHNIPEAKIQIIRNFINTKRFAPTSIIQTVPQKALYITSLRTPKHRVQLVKSICTNLGIKLKIVGGKYPKIFRLEDEINQADLVITLGRGALAAMSCARAVIIGDYAGAEGMVTSKNYLKIQRKNFSGRQLQHEVTPNWLTQEIQCYAQKMGNENRKIIQTNFNSEIEIPKILALCSQANKNFKSKKLNLPTSEITWMYENYIASLPEHDWRWKLKNIAKKTLPSL